MFLIPLFSVVAAIVLVVYIVQLRQIAATPFARTSGQWVKVAPPAAVADLYAAAEAELSELGFAPARWLHLRSKEVEVAPLRAVHVHAACPTALWLEPPHVLAPNRLSAYFVSRLLDGRLLISQPFDVFFEIFVADQDIVRPIDGETLSQQWAAHQALLATHGPADPAAVTVDALLAFTNDWMEQRRQALIADACLKPTSADSARPTLGFAWRLLRAARRMRKPPANTAPVPPARVAMVAMRLEKVRTRSPARSVEITLFAISVALFMALGAMFWDFHTAWIILVVIVVHELGHFLAMRAFGYRNVHMMALPLVGGVAIGQDVNPSAYRSAWMSLMGPLPGIVIGWGILISVWTGFWPSAAGDPMTWVILLLVINYLNVLPIPPLDGGHVMQALLPPRQAWIEVGFVAVACTLGAWVAWQFDFDRKV